MAPLRRLSNSLLFLALSFICIIGCEDKSTTAQKNDTSTNASLDAGTSSLSDVTPAPPTLITERSCDILLRHQITDDVSEIEVAGAWNNWTPTSMNGPDASGWVSVNLGTLDPGEYGYKFILDGVWEETLPIWAYTQWVDGIENRSLRVGDCHKPLLQTVSAAASADGTLQVQLQMARAHEGASLDPATVSITKAGIPIQDGFSMDAETGMIEINLTNLPQGKHSIEVVVSDDNGIQAENTPLWIPLWVEPQPFRWTDGLMYFAFTDRFRNGDVDDNALFSQPIDDVAAIANYQGGDFLGIQQALDDDYFTKLGVKTIWLSPVYDNPEGRYLDRSNENYFSGFHGYWPIDPLAIENRFGDTGASAAERLTTLIQNAHNKGIRVLFDLVLNHVHEDHPYVSAHPEWFGEGCVCGLDGCDWDERVLDCWFVPYLPDLNYRNHAITQRVVADTMTLLRTYDVDGIRIDAAKHMDHVVMRTLSKRIREEIEVGDAAPFYIVGETFTGSDGHDQLMAYVNDWELDGQFDFPLFWAIRNAFNGGSFRDLENQVQVGVERYGNATMAPFFGNHDVARWSTELAGNAQGSFGNTEDLMATGDTVTQWNLINPMSQAMLFTFTLPGVPLLYYGDEIGLAGAGDPDNRRMMTFAPHLSANQTTLLERAQEIGQARANSKALQRGVRTQLWVDDDFLVYSLDAGGQDIAIVAMNKGSSTRQETVTIPHEALESITLQGLVNTTQSATIENGQMVLELHSWEYTILAP